MSKPVVVLIFTHKANLEWYERISLEQCCRVLGDHPIRLICPIGLNVDAYRTIAPGLEIDFIPAHWLASLGAYNRLKILPWLYRRYSEFDYILTHELDAFVFRDDLIHWCDRGWDYIGAPWFEGYDSAEPDARPAGVGNSGFCLRRTQAFLRVSRTWRYQQPAGEVLQEWRKRKRSLNETLVSLTSRNNFFAPFNDYEGQEDFFWCRIVAQRFPWFRVAPYEEGRQFSFETNPRRLFSECGNVLPFGCHKWMTYEPEFWAPFIAQAGYSVPELTAVL